MSIGELLNLYRDNELDIHPEFQRFFRWSDWQKSRLIESILLGIPIPSIFVAQRQDGVWDVIDGLQRLSTIFQLIGVLKDESGMQVQPLVLTGTKYLPALEGKIWDDNFANEDALDRDQQLIIKRSKLDVKIILRESDESSKYELFQRLNTGGSPLSDQELRNCILITVDRDFYAWVSMLADDENFRTCLSLSDRLIDEQYHVELATRFVIFRIAQEKELKSIGDIGVYLTDRSVEAAEKKLHKSRVEERAFRTTFRILSQSVGESRFHRFDPVKSKFVGCICSIRQGGGSQGVAKMHIKRAKAARI